MDAVLRFSIYFLATFHIIDRVLCNARAIQAISVDDLGGVDRVFDGIGGISGGGATSKLLMNYQEPHRSNILDYLFKPGFGASLQILKVEIGGDSQSSDGSESSHMHTADDQNYDRGYEWWLMTEAKKRNPSIKLYGLPWTFPGWVGSGRFNPFIDRTATAMYAVNWVEGALSRHNLTIDYLGIWNERTCDVEYVKLLRKTLDQRGFSHVMVVAPDAMDWSLLKEMAVDANFSAAIDIIGQHYPGASSPVEARATGKRLWGSEEYSVGNSLSGGGCWARVLNESPVNAKLTAFIAWNMIASYYDGFPYTRDGLMTANQPWGGHYEVTSPIWVSAHHTQFYFPGWSYLNWNHGVGNFSGNGTYIALTTPDRTQLTIVISTLDPGNAPCGYPMPHYPIAQQQTVQFTLAGAFKSIASLNVWFSRFDFSGNKTEIFQRIDPIKVAGGTFTMVLNKNELYTLTTSNGGHKGDYGEPPPPKAFPVPYIDSFEGYAVGAEPFNLAQQSGSFGITDSADPARGKVVTQLSTQPPVDTCGPASGGVFARPIALLGDSGWKNVRLEVDVMVEKQAGAATGVFIASQLSSGGCWAMSAGGFHFWISMETGTAALTGNQQMGAAVYGNVTLSYLQYGVWYNMALDVQDQRVTASLDGAVIMAVSVKSIPSNHGFIAVGPDRFGTAHFDNLKVLRADAVTLPTDFNDLARYAPLSKRHRYANGH